MIPNIKLSELPRIKAFNRAQLKFRKFVKLPQAAIISWFGRDGAKEFGYIPVEVGEDFDSRYGVTAFMYALVVRK